MKIKKAELDVWVDGVQAGDMDVYIFPDGDRYLMARAPSDSFPHYLFLLIDPDSQEASLVNVGTYNPKKSIISINRAVLEDISVMDKFDANISTTDELVSVYVNGAKVKEYDGHGNEMVPTWMPLFRKSVELRRGNPQR